MNAVASLVLGPVVSCSAPVGRPLASLANRSMQKSSAGRIQAPIVLDFHSDDGREKIRKWYEEQPETRFRKLEYRKDIDGQFKHEFIVVHLESPDLNGAICRFDRRAQEDRRGNALKHEGTISEDSAYVITPLDMEGKATLAKSKVVLSVDFKEEQDLKYILAVCCGIQLHPNAKSYSLLCYNCYFFCWALVMTTARRVSRWELSGESNPLWQQTIDVLFHRFQASQAQYFQKRGLRDLALNQDPDEPLLLPNEKCIYQNMKTALNGYSLAIPTDVLEKTLLQAQLYPILRNEISSALKAGGLVGVETLIANPAKSGSGIILGIPDSKEDSQGEILSFGRRFALSNIVPSSWFSSITKQRTLENAQEISAKLHDKLMASSDDSAYFTHFALHQCYRAGYSWSLPPSAHLKGDSTYKVLLVEDEIRERVVNHFEQVERYGFGNAGELIDQVEKTMVKIWEYVVDIMRDESGLSFLW